MKYQKLDCQETLKVIRRILTHVLPVVLSLGLDLISCKAPPKATVDPVAGIAIEHPMFTNESTETMPK